MDGALGRAQPGLAAAQNGPVAQAGIPERGRRRDMGQDPRRRRRTTEFTSRSSSSTTASTRPPTTQTGRRTRGMRPIPADSSRSPEDFFTDPNARRDHPAQVPLHRRALGLVPGGGGLGALQRGPLDRRLRARATRPTLPAGTRAWPTSIRSIDVYGHLITTSTENLRSPIYEKLDYFQPHLYASNLIAASRIFVPALRDAQPSPRSTARRATTTSPPPPRLKKAGLNLVPPVWASVMGQGSLPAQPWDGWQLLEQNRLNELGRSPLPRDQPGCRAGTLRPFPRSWNARSRFRCGCRRGSLAATGPRSTSTTRWTAAEPLERRRTSRATLVGKRLEQGRGFPGPRDLPPGPAPADHDARERGFGGGRRRRTQGERRRTGRRHPRWAGGAGRPGRLGTLEFPVAAGRPRSLARGPGSGLDRRRRRSTLGLDGTGARLIGRRNDHFIEAWVWNRENLYALKPAAPPRPAP